MSYAAVAAKAIELGGRYSGEETPENIHHVTQRASSGRETVDFVRGQLYMQNAMKVVPTACAVPQLL